MEGYGKATTASSQVSQSVFDQKSMDLLPGFPLWSCGIWLNSQWKVVASVILGQGSVGQTVGRDDGRELEETKMKWNP